MVLLIFMQQKVFVVVVVVALHWGSQGIAIFTGGGCVCKGGGVLRSYAAFEILVSNICFGIQD